MKKRIENGGEGRGKALGRKKREATAVLPERLKKP